MTDLCQSDGFLGPKSSGPLVKLTGVCGSDGYSWLYYGDQFVNFFLVSDVFVVSEVCFGLPFVSQSFIIELAFAHKKIFYCQVRTQNPRAAFTFYFRTYLVDVLKFKFLIENFRNSEKRWMKFMPRLKSVHYCSPDNFQTDLFS